MKIKLIHYLIAVTVFIFTSCNDNKLHVKTNSKTLWWVGVINQGVAMPYVGTDEFEFDLHEHPQGNQVQPLLLSDQGNVIWCDNPPVITFKNGEVIVDAKGRVEHTKVGTTLKEAYQYASKTYFPPSGKTPDLKLISEPQYNTWIELMYDQNQTDILEYANAIIKNDYPPGVIMIDDNWQENYGKWDFHPGRFDNPKIMIDSLHNMGFKVMVWVCPFVSPDCDVYRQLAAEELFMKDSDLQPAIVRWWNGASALLDFTNDKAVDWFNDQLDFLVEEYNVDGFKLDAGDPFFYKGLIASKDIIPDEHTYLYGKFGLRFPLNEYRAMWKMGGQPVVERLRDKNHKWGDVKTLIPNMLLQGINGYVFGCPDMIGGGEFQSFLNVSDSSLDQELIVRSAQIHALLPMMQFSVAPWRVLNEKNQAAVLKAVDTRMQFTSYILRLAEEAAQTNEPIVKYLEYAFPHQGYANIQDEFLLGDSILVAPIVEENSYKRKVKLPQGIWQFLDGKEFVGPIEIEVDAPIDVLPYFVKVG